MDEASVRCFIASLRTIDKAGSHVIMTLNIPLAMWPFVLKAALPLISQIRLAFTAFGPPVFLDTAAFWGAIPFVACRREVTAKAATRSLIFRLRSKRYGFFRPSIGPASLDACGF